MAKAFDPYHRWLGIPPKEQPPHHYRLLAVATFEDDPDVIEAAADQRMAHLRTYQSGKQSALSQKLLNEVAAAKICLLNPPKKAEYDRTLRQQLQAKRKVIPTAEPLQTPEVSKTSEVSPAEPLQPTEPQQPADSGLARLFEQTGGGADSAKAGLARSRRQTRITAGVAIVVVGLIAVVGLILWATGSSSVTMLSLEWPEPQRRAGSLQIDGRRVDLYATGSLEYPLEPGDHYVIARRPGYQPHQEKFTLVQGKRLTLRPDWRKPPEGKVEPKTPVVKPPVVKPPGWRSRRWRRRR